MKIYQSEINLPDNVYLEKEKNGILFFGPLGFSQINLRRLDQKGFAALSYKSKKKSLQLKSSGESFFNYLETKINNKINGVSRGFLVYLRIVGVGYRATLQQSSLRMKIGFSHDVKYQIPPSIRIFLIERDLICLFGIDKNQVTQIAAKIRKIKPPSPYKGKGIKLIEEMVFLKKGKQK